MANYKVSVILQRQAGRNPSGSVTPSGHHRLVGSGPGVVLGPHLIPFCVSGTNVRPGTERTYPDTLPVLRHSVQHSFLVRWVLKPERRGTTVVRRMCVCSLTWSIKSPFPPEANSSEPLFVSESWLCFAQQYHPSCQERW